MFLGTDTKGRATESELASIFLTKRPGNDFPKDKPIAVSLAFYYPYRKSEKKSIVKSGEIIPHTSKPDLDNMCKGCADVLTRCGFWNDDSQIYSLSLSKHYSPTPGIMLKIVPVE
jgi:Holliday junction resolvase RusA-like endonuclease